MKEKVGVINVRPTPSGYARGIIQILEYSKSSEDIMWAEQQIITAFEVAAQLNPNEWSGVVKTGQKLHQVKK